jgi:predicted homoserine dehydrogenase-like protein
MTLRSRFNNQFKNSSLNVALVGAGQMGQGIVSQLSKQEGIHLSYIIDRNKEKAEEAVERYKKHKTGLPQIKTDLTSFELIDVDVVIEATGSPISGAIVGESVLNKGIDLILLNVETEATIGLELRRIAEENSCIVTVGHGDEPTAAMELYDFARELSFDVISIGKGKNNVFNQFAVPTELENEAKEKKMSSKMLTSFVDGTKTMIEMTALANSIDFTVDKQGMHGPETTYDELNKIFIPKKNGGILTNQQVVDYAFGIAPGVFAVIYSEDDYVNYEMEYLKMGEGPYWTLYRPYHLTSLEIPRTIMHLAVNKDTILNAKTWNVYVAAYAKKDLKKGDRLGSIGGNCYYGVATNQSYKESYLPVGIAENATMTESVIKGDPILLDQVEIEQNTIYKIWKDQEENLL